MKNKEKNELTSISFFPNNLFVNICIRVISHTNASVLALFSLVCNLVLEELFCLEMLYSSLWTGLFSSGNLWHRKSSSWDGVLEEILPLRSYLCLQSYMG